MLLVLSLRNLFWTQSHKMFLLCLLLEIWCILRFRLIIHFELIFVYFAKYGTKYSFVLFLSSVFLHKEVPGTICWKNCFSSTELPLQLCRKSINNILWLYLWTFLWSLIHVSILLLIPHWHVYLSFVISLGSR